ncbi:TetR/AcrR family transcriptional regulator [Halopseudomonas laoshanensis]|uniref:TetR/AcrR family transcriptional regulator n=2 Tax=Halopseudomonas TaxID=2901189 RepID=A0A7V7GRX1_9GAMM|nr:MULTISPECIES: TetR/AcrR family transcriptional regulator [Halopseudomonas]KAA0693457.1 TetR/AcrR family transcriptional regulator [Halopseudomonas laoshanensis]PCD01279.1 TetR family transcriptional regulator [Halopseudomonas pelagia]QFY57570.1 TetR/AcrR family transcriptional regulator [Halopseudomonas pelagia]
MSLDQRREQEKQERRDSILDAAEKAFFSKGFDKCSMDEIARTAQLSRALLYVYFKDKTAIMRGIMLRSVQALRDRFVAVAQSDAVGIEKVGALGAAYYAFSCEEPDYFDVLTQSGTFPHLLDEDDQSQALQGCGNQVMQLMVEVLQQGIADGSLSPERVADPVMTAYFLRGALHGVIMEARQPDQKATDLPDADALISYTIGMLGHSMRP